MKYYLAVNGQSTGPYEPSELLSMGANASSMVWNETMPSWTAAANVPELAEAFNQATVYSAYPPMDLSSSGAPQRYAGPQFPGNKPPRPEVSKGKSILGLFGVTPLGVLGLVFGGIANKKYDQGDYVEAENKARLARKFAKLGAIFFWVCLGILILYIIMEVVLVAALSSY